MPQNNPVKNIAKSSTSHRLFLAGFVLIALVGVFGPLGEVNAQTYTGPGQCWKNGFIITSIPVIGAITNQTQCESTIPGAGAGGTWQATGASEPGPPNGPATSTTTSARGQSAFDTAVKKNSCGMGWATGGGSFGGCILQFVYWTFYTLGGWLLAIAASFFNFFIKITLGSEFLKSPFVSHAWAVVRDLSNIFFILILLYVAVKMILGLGGHDAKKMIVQVIIMALLINFSMFFTHVVIDTSNMLALVFYNKLKTTPDNTSPNAAEQLIDTATGEKDVAGGLTQSFNPAYKLDSKFFTEAGVIKIPGQPAVKEPISTGTLIGITVIAGAIMLFAAYALFISALSFLGRLIELFVLIIFSPFAFMSSSLPLLGHVEYIGWDAWLKRLFAISFMAPIFMFFLYFIFLLLGPDMFTVKGDGGTVNKLLSIIVPALVILILLLKATEFAKKGSGKFGEMAIKGGQLAAGLAGGLALGGAGIALRAGVGGVGGFAANKLASGANRIGATTWGRRLGANKLASGLTSVGAYAQKSSFDVRGTALGKAAISASGFNLGEAQKGGITQARKEKVEKRRKRAELLNVREDEKISKNIRNAEMDLQVLLNKVAGEFDKIDKDLVDLRQQKNDATTEADKNAITALIKAKIQDKKDIKEGKTGVMVEGGTNGGKTIKELENSKDGIIPQLKREKEAESRRRKVAFANRKGNWGILSSTANKEARHKIIMESKIESKGDAH